MKMKNYLSKCINIMSGLGLDTHNNNMILIQPPVGFSSE